MKAEVKIFEDYAAKVNVKTSNKKVPLSIAGSFQKSSEKKTDSSGGSKSQSMKYSKSRGSTYEKFLKLSSKQRILIVNWQSDVLIKQNKTLRETNEKNIEKIIVGIILVKLISNTSR